MNELVFIVFGVLGMVSVMLTCCVAGENVLCTGLVLIMVKVLSKPTKEGTGLLIVDLVVRLSTSMTSWSLLPVGEGVVFDSMGLSLVLVGVLVGLMGMRGSLQYVLNSGLFLMSSDSGEGNGDDVTSAESQDDGVAEAEDQVPREYDEDGFDAEGYDRMGINEDGFTRNGGKYDVLGIDVDGYTSDGYNRFHVKKAGEFHSMDDDSYKYERDEKMVIEFLGEGVDLGFIYNHRVWRRGVRLDTELSLGGYTENMRETLEADDRRANTIIRKIMQRYLGDKLVIWRAWGHDGYWSVWTIWVGVIGAIGKDIDKAVLEKHKLVLGRVYKELRLPRGRIALNTRWEEQPKEVRHVMALTVLQCLITGFARDKKEMGEDIAAFVENCVVGIERGEKDEKRLFGSLLIVREGLECDINDIEDVVRMLRENLYGKRSLVAVEHGEDPDAEEIAVMEFDRFIRDNVDVYRLRRVGSSRLPSTWISGDE